jgi:hypothetical protein
MCLSLRLWANRGHAFFLDRAPLLSALFPYVEIQATYDDDVREVPHAGRRKPSGQRNRWRKLRQASSKGNYWSNSTSVAG